MYLRAATPAPVMLSACMLCPAACCAASGLPATVKWWPLSTWSVISVLPTATQIFACLQTLQSNPGGYLQQRKQIVMLAAQLATALQLTEQLAHAAVSLLDRTMMTGAHMAAGTEVLVAVACLRIAALHEGAFVPTLAQVAAVVDIPGGHSCGAPSAVASLPCACEGPGTKAAVGLPRCLCACARSTAKSTHAGQDAAVLMRYAGPVSSCFRAYIASWQGHVQQQQGPIAPC